MRLWGIKLFPTSLAIVTTIIPEPWHDEIRLFTEIEFKSVVTCDGGRVEKTSSEISEHFNEDAYIRGTAS